MLFIFSTGSLYTYSVERCFAFAARAGFDGVEVMIDQRWETRQADLLRTLAARHGQPVVAVHSPFTPTVPGWPADEVGRILESVRLAEALGAKVVVHHLPQRGGYLTVQIGPRRLIVPIPGWQPQAAYQRWLEEEYATAQARTAVRLCIENMPARRQLGRRWNGCRWNTPEQIVRFPALTLDTTHLATWGLEPFQVYPRLGGRVRHVHLSNFDGREHRRPEVGRLRLDRLLSQLAAEGYSGAICLELHPNALEEGSPDERIVGLLRDSLVLCRRWAGRR